jgi:D-sedoheptulose 7-phosphate isomerase
MNLNEYKKLVNDMNQNDLDRLESIVKNYQTIILIGNGGSNAIASHISNDYTKILGKKAFAFTDASILTCYVNDYGSDNAYAKYISNFCDNNTLVILISSSGNSVNIYNAAQLCKDQKIPFVILTGFEKNNKIIKDFASDSQMSIWIDSKSYAVVECLHEAYLHGIVHI